MNAMTRAMRALLATAAGVLLFSGAGATAAYAASDDEPPSPVTLSEAVEIAQSESPGCEAFGVFFEEDGDVPVWNVELSCEDGVWTQIRVDAEAGTVIDEGDPGDAPE
ncbi:MAG: PepSY domain-containing protein [Stackebrandtia sp.]